MFFLIFDVLGLSSGGVLRFGPELMSRSLFWSELCRRKHFFVFWKCKFSKISWNGL